MLHSTQLDHTAKKHPTLYLNQTTSCKSRVYGMWTSFASAAFSAEWSSTTHRRKAQVRLHHRHHALRPPLAAGTTTYPVQALYASKQVSSSYGTVVPDRQVHSRVVHSRSSTSPLSCSSRSHDFAQSAGAMWITQLRRFRPFALELAAVDYPWPDPDIRWFL